MKRQMKRNFFSAALAVVMCFDIAAAAIDFSVSDKNITIGETEVAYSAKITNNSGNVTNPALIEAYYENDVLKEYDIQVSSDGVSDGGDTTLDTKVNAAITNNSRVVGISLNNLTDTVPIDICKIKNVGSGENEITGIGILGVSPDSVVLDNSNNLISVYLPLYNDDGSDFSITALKTTLTLSDSKAGADVYDSEIKFTGTGVTKMAEVDYSQAPVFVITAEDGSTRIYRTKIYRKTELDFEDNSILGGTLINGSFVENPDQIITRNGTSAGKSIYFETDTSNINADYDNNMKAELVSDTEDKTKGKVLYLEKLLSKSAPKKRLKLQFGKFIGLSTLPKEFSAGYDIRMEKANGDNDSAGVSGFEVYTSALSFRIDGSGNDYSPNNTKIRVCGKSSSYPVTNWNTVRVDWNVDDSNELHSTTHINGEHFAAADDVDSTNFGGNVKLSDSNASRAAFSIGLGQSYSAKMYIDNIFFTYLLSDSMNVDVDLPNDDEAPTGSANDLSFIPVMSQDGVISVSGTANAGRVFAAVYKVLDPDRVPDFENASNFVAIDASNTDENGKFSFNWRLADADDNGYYAFLIGNTDNYSTQVLRRKVIYFASQAEIEAALQSVNSASEDTLMEILEKHRTVLQISSILESADYSACRESLAPVIIAERGTGFAQTEEIVSALRKAVGVCTIAKSTQDTLEASLNKYAELLGIDLMDYEPHKRAVARCFETVSKEFTEETALSSTNISELVERSIALAKVNLATKGNVIDVIWDNEAIFDIDPSELTSEQQKSVAEMIYVVNTEYATVKELKTAYSNAVKNLGKSSSSSGTSSGNRGVSSGKSDIKFGVSEDYNIQDSTANQEYLDLDSVEWARAYIESLSSVGIFNGKGDGIFDPMADVTREEFAKILVSALHIKADHRADFTDISGDEWFAPYVGAAAFCGLVEGYPDGTFGIGESVTRQDAAVMISRALGDEDETEPISFVDKDMIADYAKDDVARCLALGIINGYENNEFRPENAVTRAECAKMIYYFVDSLENNDKEDKKSKEDKTAAQKLDVLKKIGVLTLDVSNESMSDNVTNAELAGAVVDMLGESERNNTHSRYSFSDVTADTLNANKIESALNFGLVDKSEVFHPNVNATSDMAVDMVIRLLGYEKYKVVGDTWQAANNIDLLDGTNIVRSSYITWEQLIALLYNAIEIDVLKFGGIINGSMQFASASNKSILTENFDIYKIEGVVRANEYTSLTGSAALDEGMVQVDDIRMKVGNTAASLYLGYNVEGYAKLEGEGYTLLYISPDRNGTTVIDADELLTDSSMWSLNKIVYSVNNKTKTLSLSRNTDIVYNGKLFLTCTAEDLKIKSGTITAVDNNATGNIDVLIVNETDDYVVSTYSSFDEIIYDKSGRTIKLKDDVSMQLYNVLDEPYDLSDLIENTVLTISVSKDGKLITGYACRSKVSGVVDTILCDGSGNPDIVSLDGTKYSVAKSWESAYFTDKPEIKLGTRYLCYLNAMGEIALFVEKSVEGEQYGYLDKLSFETKFDTTPVFKIFTQFGKWEKYEGAKKMKVNSVIYNGSNTGIFDMFVNSGDTKEQLVKFTLDSENRINSIYTAVERTESSASDGLINDGKVNERYRTESGFFGLKTYIKPTTKFFSYDTDSATGDIDKDSFEMLTTSDFYNDRTYSFNAYDIDEYGGLGAAIIANKAENDYWNTGAIFVKSVSNVIGDNDEERIELNALNNGVETSFYASDDRFIKGVEAGDIIVAHFNQKGEINRDIITLYKNGEIFTAQEKPLKGNASYAGEVYVMQGHVVLKNESAMVLDYGTNTAKIPLSVVKNIIVYDTKTTRENNIFTIGSLSDIYAGNSLDSASNVLVYFRSSMPVSIVVIK